MPAFIGGTTLVATIVILAITGVVAVLTVLFLERPDRDPTPFLAIIVGFLAPTIASLVSLLKLEQQGKVLERQNVTLSEQKSTLEQQTETLDQVQKQTNGLSDRLGRLEGGMEVDREERRQNQ